MKRPTQRRSAAFLKGRRARADQPDPALAARALRAGLRGDTRIAVVLGSGFAGLLQTVDLDGQVPFTSVPGLVSGAVSGHPGAFFKARIHDHPVLLLAGRSHVYEGFSAAEVAFPMRIIAALGVEIVVLTNAAGGIHRDLTAGSFMILRDHINLQGVNPLTGPELEGQSRFVDMTSVYDLELRRMLRRAAKTVRVTAREGVYLAVAGPSYETPAEVRAFHRLGADAVGMSTVAEAIVARQCGLRVAGLSLITNKAAGLSCGALSHDDVLARGRSASAAVGRWINEFIRLSTSAADLPSVRAGKSRLPAQG